MTGIRNHLPMRILKSLLPRLLVKREYWISASSTALKLKEKVFQSRRWSLGQVMCSICQPAGIMKYFQVEVAIMEKILIPLRMGGTQMFTWHWTTGIFLPTADPHSKSHTMTTFGRTATNRHNLEACTIYFNNYLGIWLGIQILLSIIASGAAHRKTGHIPSDVVTDKPLHM